MTNEELLGLFKTIEDDLSLHTEVSIVYVVDGYKAQLISESENVIATGDGKSIISALIDLELKLSSK